MIGAEALEDFPGDYKHGKCLSTERFALHA